MALYTRRFQIAKHEEYGMVGLRPTWMADHQSDPLTGMGVAHDILEHGDQDTVEWQGLGGAVYIRGEQDYFQRTLGNPDPAENIGSEFTSLYSLWEGGAIPDPGRTYPCAGDEMIAAVIDAGCRGLRAEAPHMGGPDSPAKIRAWTSKEQQRRMRGWMRKGYRACAQRWRKYPAWKMTETFRKIEGAVDRFLKEYGEYEGSIAIVSFNPAREWAQVELEEEWPEGED